MGTPIAATYDDFAEWKQSVEARLRQALARATSRPQFGVSSGGFDVKNNGAVRIYGSGGLKLISGDDVEVVNMSGWTGAYTEPDGEPQPMVFLRRSDGSLAFFLGDVLPLVGGYQQFWAWYDRQGTIVAGDDTTSGRGLARPYMSYHVGVPSDTITLTSTASFAESHVLAGYVQNPRMSVPVSCTAPATGAAEVRIVHVGSGDVVAGPTGVPAGTSVAPFYEFNVPASVDMFTYHYFSVQTRRTSGTGNVTSTVFSAHGMQS